MDEEILNRTRKRLIWRADHRGTKETDLLLGAFARQHLPGMDEDMLRVFDEFMTIPDPVLHLILTGEAPVPPGFPASFVEHVRNFRFRPTMAVL